MSFELVIERAHRTGTRSRLGAADGINTRQRTIECRLRDCLSKQKDEILRAARRMKPPGTFLSEDLANETMEKRKAQLDKLKETRKPGKMAYFVCPCQARIHKEQIALCRKCHLRHLERSSSSSPFGSTRTILEKSI